MGHILLLPIKMSLSESLKTGKKNEDKKTVYSININYDLLCYHGVYKCFC